MKTDKILEHHVQASWPEDVANLDAPRANEVDLNMSRTTPPILNQKLSLGEYQYIISQ